MKKIFLSFFLLNSIFLFAQEKYFTKSGEIIFEASVPSFEEVKATNNKVTAILNMDTGKMAALALVKGFRFKIALMEEHFNENYAESDKYSKAKFTGKIINFDKNILSKNLLNNIEIEGELTFHGSTKIIRIPATIEKKESIIKLLAIFKVKPEDYNIKIPKLLSKKVAKEIDIQLNFKLKKK